MTSSHQPLFNQKFIAKRTLSEATPASHKELLQNWATTIRSGLIRKQKESELRGAFIQRFFVEMLGYRPFGNGNEWTINDEKRTGSGSADSALGFFSEKAKTVYAPVELKGADTSDLDAIMPGRHKSPVQQVWEYAMDTPGCHFMLVSNMVEIRLYATLHTRQVYERFDILELAESDTAYQRFRLLLSAENLLQGNTAKLLLGSAEADKEITQKLYADYKSWRVSLLVSLMQSTGRSAKDLIEPVQKLLDRILFVAFAEDRGLLPEKTLTQAFNHRDPYNPRPIWENFLGLFRAIDKGNLQLGIPAYNGGLFAADEVLDTLPVSDASCHMFGALGEYDFAEDVSVTVLGHIFEQSVSDLEKLKETANSEECSLKILKEQKSGGGRSVSGKRKVDGIVYTPDPITRFIVDETLGTYLDMRRDSIRGEFWNEGNGWRSPSVEEKKLTGRKKQIKLKSQERLVEFLFWTKWREELSQIRVVDPACGSGAFLVAAFDLLDIEYRQANEQIQAITGNPDLFDISREILNSNLYGVDLNPESIEISKLSLWLKTAQRGKPLESLEANLLVGNSLIDDDSYSDRPFDWEKSFANVFAEGGFDVVLGNPPYVRMELLKPTKPFLQRKYAVASDRADLYCYFYELGLSLLRPGGRLGYISSASFFKTGAGEPLRRHLLSESQIKTLVDFGDIQIFDGVTTYPAVVIIDNIVPSVSNSKIRILSIKNKLPESLAAAFSQDSRYILQSQLSSSGWTIATDMVAALMIKLTSGHPTIKDIYGAPQYGIKSGLESAFIIDNVTRSNLIKHAQNSSDLLKHYIEGKHLKSWCIESEDLWIIYTPKKSLDISSYPGIEMHLFAYKKKLELRAAKQAWFELQQPQERYSKIFEGTKIVYPDITDKPRFSIDSGSFLATTCFCINTSDHWVCALLNSKPIWWLVKQITPSVRGGFHRLKTQYIETLPIPNVSLDERSQLDQLSKNAHWTAEARGNLVTKFRRRMLTDLASPGVKLNKKLMDWPSLDFQELHNEIKKCFKRLIPLAERDDWQSMFESTQTKISALDADLTGYEQDIDQLVCSIFKLTSAEIELLENK